MGENRLPDEDISILVDTDKTITKVLKQKKGENK